MGRPASANKALIFGALATIVAIGAALALPAKTPGSFLPIVSIVVMMQIAKVQQGEIFENHKRGGGKVASNWRATGIGLLFMVLVLAIIFAWAIASDDTPSKKYSLGNLEVLYSGSSTEAEAQALYNALVVDADWDPATRASVVLIKKHGQTTIEFVVNPEAGKKDATLALYTAVVERIARSVGGKPITLKLVNPELEELKSKKIE